MEIAWCDSHTPQKTTPDQHHPVVAAKCFPGTLTSPSGFHFLSLYAGLVSSSRTPQQHFQPRVPIFDNVGQNFVKHASLWEAERISRSSLLIEAV